MKKTLLLLILLTISFSNYGRLFGVHGGEWVGDLKVGGDVQVEDMTCDSLSVSGGGVGLLGASGGTITAPQDDLTLYSPVNDVEVIAGTGEISLQGDVEITRRLKLSQITVTENYEASTKQIIFVDATDGATTITLFPAAESLQYTIKKIDSTTNNVTIDGYLSEEVEFELIQTLTTQGDTITVVSDGTQWLAI